MIKLVGLFFSRPDCQSSLPAPFHLIVTAQQTEGLSYPLSDGETWFNSNARSRRLCFGFIKLVLVLKHLNTDIGRPSLALRSQQHCAVLLSTPYWILDMMKAQKDSRSIDRSSSSAVRIWLVNCKSKSSLAYAYPTLKVHWSIETCWQVTHFESCKRNIDLTSFSIGNLRWDF